MKFTTNSNELKTALSNLVGIISNNPVLPILEDFLFEIDGDKLTITATDLETFISTYVKISSEGKYSVAIPAKILLDTIRQLPSQPIGFEFSAGQVLITSVFGEYTLATEDGNEYPKPPQPDSDKSVTLHAGMLKNAIEKTIFATSTDDLRPAMCGVLFEVYANGVNFVATDAHKLSLFTHGSPEGENTNLIVPKKPLSAIKNALPPDSMVEISYSAQNAFFTFAGYQISCRLTDARYPQYRGVIPKNEKQLTVNKSDFLSSVKRVANYANKTTNQIKLNITQSGITISAENVDISTKCSEKLPCEFTDGSLQIGFNSKYLIEILSVLDGDTVRIKLSEPNRAGVLYGDNDELMCLLMPVILN